MKRLFCLCLLLGLSAPAFSQRVQIVQKGAIHEALVTHEEGQIVLQAIAEMPPAPIREERPHQSHLLMVWLPGYWHFSQTENTFHWVSGIWRRPPPGHTWISGFWQEFPEGWVWVPGFWSPVPEAHLTYIADIPPTPLNEHIPSPPRPGNRYFWAPGYWHYNETRGDYRWLSGRWSEIQTKWVYTPSHYQWREKGYLEIPGYWDYPIEKRGYAYPTLYIPPDEREHFVYTPEGVLHPLYIMEILYPDWPSYASLFRYHYAFQAQAWEQWGTVPPWWNWWTWWSLPYHESLALWWWWSHTYYPNPEWINRELAAMITPPSEFVLKMMSWIEPVADVTPRGVVSSQRLTEVIHEVTDQSEPIMPHDPTQFLEIQKVADPRPQRRGYIRPRGSEEVPFAPVKPSTGPQPSELKYPPKGVPVPPIPAVEQVPHEQEMVITFRDHSDHPDRKPPEQGATIEYEYPQKPMQSESLDSISNYPLPQKNPPGPNVHPKPGDYSTGPG